MIDLNPYARTKRGHIRAGSRGEQAERKAESKVLGERSQAHSQLAGQNLDRMLTYMRLGKVTNREDHFRHSALYYQHVAESARLTKKSLKLLGGTYTDHSGHSVRLEDTSEGKNVSQSAELKVDWSHYEDARREYFRNRKKNPVKPININTATVRELEKLPGIGRGFATRIVEWRMENGLFSLVEDLSRVPGIGPKTLGVIKTNVTTGRSRPASRTHRRSIMQSVERLSKRSLERLGINTSKGK